MRTMSEPGLEELLRLSGAFGLDDILGKNLDEIGGVLRCDRCKREMPMQGAARYMRQGWPECCGYTMLWVTARQLAEASGKA